MARLSSVKFSRKEYAGQTLNFPLIGSATFDKDGILEVADDKVDEFIELTLTSFAFENLDAVEEETEEEFDESKETDKSLASEKPKKVVSKTAQKKKELKMQAHLDSLNFKELIELAKETDIPPESLAAMTDKKLKKELLIRLVK